MWNNAHGYTSEYITKQKFTPAVLSNIRFRRKPYLKVIVRYSDISNYIASSRFLWGKKYILKYVGACTRAAEGSDLDKVLSRLRDHSSWSTSRRAVSCTCLSMLAPPDPGGGGLGRALVGSRERVLAYIFE